jgi:hypothetical protein
MRGIRTGSEALVALLAFLYFLARVPTVSRLLINPDHGYMLALGAELLRGHWPSVHVLSHYGPLVAVLSAATQWSTGDLRGEAVLCAAGWALAAWLLYRLGSRLFGAPVGLCAFALGLACSARFHKWYVWLIPLAALAIVDRTRRRPGGWRYGAAGLLCGFAGLMRPEFGIATIGVLGLLALVDARTGKPAAWPWAWLPLVGGFAVPWLLWGAAVATGTGYAGLRSTVSVFVEGATGNVEAWSLPPPPFRWSAPFAPASTDAAVFWLLPGTEVLALGLGFWLGYRERTGRLAREGHGLFAIALMALALYPHVFYRPDAAHVRQGLWPLLLLLPALAAVGSKLPLLAGGDVGRLRGHARWTGAAIGALAAAVFVPLMFRPSDLLPLSARPFTGIIELSRGIEAAPRHPYARLVAEIVRRTGPADRILIASYSPQLLVFAGRAPSRFRPVYQRGLFDSPPRRAQEMERLRTSPPALVVAPLRFHEPDPDDEFRMTQPEMYAYLHERYTVKLAAHADLMLLGLRPGP